MSGLVKGIKKVFKKVASFVKKYWKETVRTRLQMTTLLTDHCSRVC